MSFKKSGSGSDILAQIDIVSDSIFRGSDLANETAADESDSSRQNDGQQSTAEIIIGEEQVEDGTDANDSDEA